MIHGYLDPASGSAIVSAVAAGGAGIVVALNTVKNKMRFRKREVLDETNDDDDLEAAGDTVETIDIVEAGDAVDETSDELTQ